MGNHTPEVILSENSFPKSTLLQPYFDFRHTETWVTLPLVGAQSKIIRIGNSAVLLQDFPQFTLRRADSFPVRNFITLNIFQNKLITSVGRLKCLVDALIVTNINQFLFFDKVNAERIARRDFVRSTSPVPVQVSVIFLIVAETVFSFRINVFSDNCWPKNGLE